DNTRYLVICRVHRVKGMRLCDAAQLKGLCVRNRALRRVACRFRLPDKQGDLNEGEGKLRGDILFAAP
ncbi:hypothetical protein, partial [Salmonella enterica]|uniref:hypothetical protein n=1 Tax=Salmonella enterica TaxID=28901 RepID=UPI001C9992BF